MNNRYLYRAKILDNGEWVEGNYECDPDLDKHYICGFNYYSSENGLERECFTHEVNKDTICQCTGLKDRNGKLIWENDICIITDGTLDEEDGYFRLDWENDRAMFEFEGTGLCANFDNVYGYECEVVGNIFDNPELLEVGE